VNSDSGPPWMGTADAVKAAADRWRGANYTEGRTREEAQRQCREDAVVLSYAYCRSQQTTAEAIGFLEGYAESLTHDGFTRHAEQVDALIARMKATQTETVQ